MSKDNSVTISICRNWVPGIIGLLALTLVPLLSAQEKNETASAFSSEKPLHITADKMIAHQETSMVEFIGHVRADQENSLIEAASISLYLHPSKPDNAGPDDGRVNANRIKQIVAVDNVEYTAGNRKAFADKAVYTAADDTLILTGREVRLLTGTSWVSGTKITLFRNQDRVMVESDGNSRVQALFNPEDKPAE
jgi:lipopolysaccharide export system protein LptA